MRYFVFFLFLVLVTIWALHEEEIDLAILLLFLDIFYIFLLKTYKTQQILVLESSRHAPDMPAAHLQSFDKASQCKISTSAACSH